MRTYPEDDSDRKDAARIKAEPWQLDQLRLNPSYVHWGPYEDYMWKEKDGWDGRIVCESWTEFGPWNLDELNELANFYFYVERDHENCVDCDSSGHNPETKRIADDWYDFAETGRRWCDKITQDEAEALYKAGRLREWNGSAWVDRPECPSAAEVNQSQSGGMLGKWAHDAINRWICVEARARRLGVFGVCQKCDGHGDVFTADEARLGLVLWWMHPRKGACRGIDVKRIEQKQVGDAYRFLAEAAQRNANRFSRVVGALEAL